MVTDGQIGAYWDEHLAHLVADIPDAGHVAAARARYITDVRANPEALRQMEGHYRDRLVVELAAVLADADRVDVMVDYWFATEGGGWVRPDWLAIARLAVGWTLATVEPSTEART